MPRLQNLDVSIQPHDGGHYTCVAASPSGEARTDFDLPFTDKDLQILVLSVLGSIGRSRRKARRIQSQERQLLEDFGGQLFQAAFSGPVRNFLDRSLAAAESKRGGLRIRLRLPPELANIPWEYLYDRESAGFVSLSPETVMVRYVEMPRPVRPFPVSPPLRILAMISAPSDVPELEGDDEWDKLTAALTGLTGQEMVQADRLEAGTLTALQQPLRQLEYHVLHFVGHGVYDEEAQDGALALEDDDGRTRLVTGRDLGVMLKGHRSLRLVVLNACEGARSARDDPFGGVAQALVRQGIPAVIAMQFEITDPAALVFSKSFYQAIADGLPVDLAMVEARKAMFAAGHEVEWATPVLYLRSPDGQVFIKGRAPKADTQAKEEADRQAQEEADRQAQKEADRQAQEEAVRQAEAEADRRAWEEADRPDTNIFINYRHEDMPFAAMMLYRELMGRFRSENIFFDEGTLRPGTRFPEEIRSPLTDNTGAFLALIGPGWMPTMLAHQQRGDLDYVTKEIELALQNGWTVIPVLVDNATLPDPHQLPRAIRSLANRQAARLRQLNLDDDVEDLSARLNEIPEGKKDEVEQQLPIIEPPPVLAADDEHYQMLNDEADNLVIFLGAGANADDHDEPFREGAEMLPDDTELAEYLAAKIRLESGQRDLAQVAQYVRMIRGEPNVFRWVKQVVGVDSEPGPVHKYLARLPRRLEELGLRKRYPMIVTPKFDLALERALLEEGEPFDVAVYMAPGTEYAGRFVHLPWDGDPHPVITPNEYTGFPIASDWGELTRTVIVRTNGAVDNLQLGYRWKSNFIITEDHYIDYLGGRPAEEVVPTQILAKLRQASCLFLGYKIADWRLRVFLHWIWQGERLSGAAHWAVERDPDVLERQFWQRSGVALYKSRLTDYVAGLDRFLTEHRDELT